MDKEKKRNVILVTNDGIGDTEVYGNFLKMCKAKGLPYHSIKMLKFPIQCNGYLIEKKQVL